MLTLIMQCSLQFVWNNLITQKKLDEVDEVVLEDMS